ncbi:DUF3800 domain-containing protein [Brumimicrobium glaciale]|uniref:DUF3800 domain-containing protein n=1 Tax=Brumimicrobium glaciale TaxID=200475 RepID=A0A4V1WET7_9FLAO|nr:DUF3800 domain-containing protein [Brumimicrobium glaciale]RYM30836.1 DUF3800 domain-containing protein [Brumimicrobium glaciale]
MSKTYNFYCDESTHLQNDGMPYMMIAYVSVAYNQLNIHKEAIKGIRARHKVKGEIKWSNVSHGAYPFYAELIDYFFSTDINFRSIIVDKSKIDESREGFTYDDLYFRMYYQLIHHKINQGYTYNLYLDIKDTRSHKKLKKLNDILKYNASIRNCQFIRSHESSFMQLTDLIMGAINYKLRGLNKVIAKNKLIEKIEQHSKVPITKSTPKTADKFNLFFIDLQ